MSVLHLLEEDCRVVVAEGEGLRIRPGAGLRPEDLRMVKELKPELVALVQFTTCQRDILAHHEAVNLEDLHRYREGLECWLRFTPEEQCRMIGYPWTPEDLANIFKIREESGGEVIACGSALHPLPEEAPSNREAPAAPNQCPGKELAG